MNFKLISPQTTKIQTSEDQHNFFEKLILSYLQATANSYCICEIVPISDGMLFLGFKCSGQMTKLPGYLITQPAPQQKITYFTI